MNSKVYALPEWDEDANSRDPVEAHKFAQALGAKCEICPLYCRREGPVPNEIKPQSDVAIVGEAPEPQDVADGRPFSGKTARHLNTILAKFGESRRTSRLSVLNTTLCRPGGKINYTTWLERSKRKAEKEGVEWHDPRDCCRPLLEKQLEEAAPTTIVTMGALAMESVAKIAGVPVGSKQKDRPGAKALAKLSFQAGFPFEFENAYPAVSLIPTFTIRHATQKHLEVFEAIYKTLKHAFHLAKEQQGKVQIRPPDDTIIYLDNPQRFDYYDDHKFSFFQVKPEWFKFTSDVKEFIERFKTWIRTIREHPKRVLLTVDIETSGVEKDSFIRVIGHHTIINGKETVCIAPLRNYHGSDVLGPELRAWVEAALTALYALPNVDCAFHNGCFDTRVLRRDGLWPDRHKQWHDTMQMQKNSYHCDFKGRLDAVVSDRWDDFEDPRTGKTIRGTGDLFLWKGDVDHKAGGGSASDRMTEELFLALLTLYNSFDMLSQGRVARPLLAEVRHAGCTKQYNHERKLMPYLRSMEEIGLPQSRETAAKFRQKIELKMAQVLKAAQGAAAEVVKDFGNGRSWNNRIKPPKPTAEAKRKRKAIIAEQEFWGCSVPEHISIEGFNLNSDRQMSDLLYDFCKFEPVLNADGKDWEEGDNLSVGRTALFALEETGVPQSVRNLITLRVLYGSLKTNLNTFIARAQSGIPHPAWDDGSHIWLHPGFRAGTVSGRLISKPNVQNYPKMGFINARTIFRAPPGHVFVMADYDQLELRLYCGASNDQAYMQAFVDDLDAHTFGMASMLAPQEKRDMMDLYQELIRKKKGEFGPEAKKEFSSKRNLFKMVVFSMLYGAQWEKVYEILARMTSKATGTRLFPELVNNSKQIRQIYEGFKAAHPELGDWHDWCDDFVRANGYMDSMISGRRRWFKYGVNDKNAPRNMRIQASAADIADDALMQLCEAIPFGGWSPYTGVNLQCHDEIVACVPEEKAYYTAGLFNEIMPTKVAGVPITAEAEISRTYAGELIPIEEFKACAR